MSLPFKMTTDEIINSVIAGGTLATAIFAWLTAMAARAQGRAAWEQVNLQRPRPVIVVEGSWNLEEKGDGPDAFLLRNIGSSPAFDIELADIDGPLVPSCGYRERLVTDRIFVIAEKSETRGAHHRLIPATQIDHRAALDFIKTAAQSFPVTDDDPNLRRPALDFALCYSTLDGRRFSVPCQMRFWLGLNARAEIVPVSSWLGMEPAWAIPLRRYPGTAASSS